MSIITISTLSELSTQLDKIIKNTPNITYISYIDGEYGFRCLWYNGFVRHYTNKQRKSGNLVVGFCFKGNTIFLKELCDIIIEYKETAFNLENIIDDTHIDNDKNDHRIDSTPCSVPYKGTSGWSRYNTTGLHSEEYESIIDSFNFKSIIFTIHQIGHTMYVKNCRSNIIGKLNDIPIDFGRINDNRDILLSYFKPNTEISKIKKNAIACFIRNTNKCPERNLPDIIYIPLIEYCKFKKIHLNIFFDLNPVDIQESEYVHICNIRENGVLLIDKFIDICRESYIFLGADSGITEICNTYTDCNVLFYESQSPWGAVNKNIIIKTTQELISEINNIMM